MDGIAYAYINSWNSVYSNQWCNYLSAEMHEVRPHSWSPGRLVWFVSLSFLSSIF